MDGIWNRYNLKRTGRIYTFGVLKCSENFKGKVVFVYNSNVYGGIEL
jgi:hypothetical protein